jgi:hypothetical protein
MSAAMDTMHGVISRNDIRHRRGNADHITAGTIRKGLDAREIHERTFVIG